jgi:Short C-terminal domain
MNRPLQLISGLVAVGALALGCVEIAKLMDIGTCASGGPYVSANPCPAGTATRILVLIGAITLYVVALLASGQAMFFFGLLFVALAAMFIRGAFADDSFEAVGIGVGALFAVMGLGPMLMAIRGWFGADRGEATARASGIAAFTQLAQQGVMARPADGLDRLGQLGDLHARGVLTDAEFAAQKARILGGG